MLIWAEAVIRDKINDGEGKAELKGKIREEGGANEINH